MPKEWRVFPPRQITGLPFRYYGYIGRDRIEEHCCETGRPSGTHRSAPLAQKCAERRVRLINRIRREATNA